MQYELLLLYIFQDICGSLKGNGFKFSKKLFYEWILSSPCRKIYIWFQNIAFVVGKPAKYIQDTQFK